MKTKIEIKNIYGEVLFTYENENATIKEALEQAVKENAKLENANLYNAKLENAKLENADLYNADLYNAELPIFCKWSHSIKNDKIKIGCKKKTIEEWDIFFASDEVYTTERNTQDFKQIQAVYEAYKSYLTFLNK